MFLRSLSDNEILSRIQELTHRERTLTLCVLLHLNEIERRRLHLKLAYRSMFDYCTSALGYSASAASRRIRAARCVARFPEVYSLLEANQVNVSTVAQVSRILTVDNSHEILSRIQGKSQREVEAIVAEYEPSGTAPRDRVRTIVVRQPLAFPAPAACAARDATSGVPAAALASAATETATTLASSPAAGAEDKAPGSLSPGCTSGDNHDRNGRAPDSPDNNPADTTGAARLERRKLIQFCASESFMAKLEQVKSLAWHRLPANPSLAQVVELALDILIEKESPSIRREQRERRTKRVAQGTAPTPGPATHTRHIPAAVRDEVYVRDQGKCAFKAPSGKRCASENALQVDHIEPFALGGSTTIANLRLLCAYHNRLEAERLLGSAALEAPRRTLS